jgi:hypothetical protein
VAWMAWMASLAAEKAGLVLEEVGLEAFAD